MEGMRIEYHRYDIIEAEIKMTTPSGSVQKKKRPYVIVGNEKGTTTAPTVIAMPLTHGRIIPPEKVLIYKEKSTVYIYGKHPNGIIDKEYVWRLPKSKENMYGVLLPGDLIYCSTKNGIAPVIVTRIEKRDSWDTDLKVKVVCSRIIIRNGELVKYEMDKGESVNV